MTNALASVTMLVLLALSSAALPAWPAGLAAAADQLVKASSPAVYYVGTDNKRYVFPNERIFYSWYRNFSSVQTITDAQLASYPIGGTIFYRPGTRLVKITTDPKVYAVGLGGELLGIASEAAAQRLYGTAWAQRVDDLPDAFFASYHIGDELDGSEHPEGTFIRYAQNTSYYVLGRLEGIVYARPVAESLIAAFRLNKDDALTLTSAEFPYPIGEIWHADEAAAFYPNQPLAITQQPGSDAPTEPEPGQEPSPSPAPATASLTVSKLSTLAANSKAVAEDPAARIFALTITGDTKTDVTLQRLRFRVYIDAGGVDTDFVQGSDSDDPTFWAAGQVIRDLVLRNIDTGKTLASTLQLDSTGEVAFDLTTTIPAGQKLNLELTASIELAPSKVRLAVDMTPSTDITAAATSTTVSITPTTALNGGTSPVSIVSPSTYGLLVVASKNAGGDSMQTLGSTVSGYELTFTSTGEPYTVSALTFGFTVDGDDVQAIRQMQITYPKADGTTKTVAESSVDSAASLYKFINLELYVPKDKTVSVPLTFETRDDNTLNSNSRLQLKFVHTDFSGLALFSGTNLVSSSFADSSKLQDKTSTSALTVLRQGFLAFSSHPESPSGSVTRYNKIPVLTFSVSATEHDILLRQITVKVETSDLDIDGDDNDFLERAANTFANTVIGMATHDLDLSERTVVAPQSVTFSLYDKSAGTLDSTPDGIQTDTGDYGIFVLNFGSNPITISAGSTRTFDIDINTTLVSGDKEYTIRARLLGDSKSTATSQANILWDDGSTVLATGYLVPGLDITGNNLAVR